MGKLIVTEFVSLDGVMEAPGGEPGYAHSGWVMPFVADAGQQEYKLRETLDAAALLLGRVTYEGFAAAWPGREDPMGFAAKMNAMPKYVVSSTLTDPEWNNTTVVGTDLAAAVADVKGRVDGDVLVAGSRTLVHGLLTAGLVDELRLMVFPLVLGSGMRWFPESPEMATFALTDHRVFDSGVVVQTYARD